MDEIEGEEEFVVWTVAGAFGLTSCLLIALSK